MTLTARDPAPFLAAQPSQVFFFRSGASRFGFSRSWNQARWLKLKVPALSGIPEISRRPTLETVLATVLIPTIRCRRLKRPKATAIKSVDVACILVLVSALLRRPKQLIDSTKRKNGLFILRKYKWSFKFTIKLWRLVWFYALWIYFPQLYV